MPMLKSISLYGGCGLIAQAIVNTVLMFETLRRRGTPETLRFLRRRLGRIFAIVAVAQFVYKNPRLTFMAQFEIPEMFHATLGLVLLPLVIWKVLIVTRY